MTNIAVAGSYSLDEYVWLGGHPVAVSRATFALMSGFAHRYDDSLSGTNCTRNGDNVPCGFYFPVTDALGTPVVMLDANGRVTGSNDADPFGYPNRGQVSAKTSQPYADGQASVSLGTYQVASAGTSVPVSVDTRVKFSVLEILPDGGDGVFLKSGAASTAFLAGQPGSPAWTAWLPLDAGTSTVSVLFSSNASGHTDGGAVAEAFEYRRHQTSAAAPVFTSLRFPGQYHDTETDFFENWNRFYDPFSRRYLQPDQALLGLTTAGAYFQGDHSTSAYAYVGNNPIRFKDPNGKYLTVGYCENWDDALARAQTAMACDEWLKGSHCECDQKMRDCNVHDPCDFLNNLPTPAEQSNSNFVENLSNSSGVRALGITTLRITRIPDYPAKVELVKQEFDQALCTGKANVKTFANVLIEEAIHGGAAFTGVNILDDNLFDKGTKCYAQDIMSVCGVK